MSVTSTSTFEGRKNPDYLVNDVEQKNLIGKQSQHPKTRGQY